MQDFYKSVCIKKEKYGGGNFFPKNNDKSDSDSDESFLPQLENALKKYKQKKPNVKNDSKLSGKNLKSKIRQNKEYRCEEAPVKNSTNCEKKVFQKPMKENVKGCSNVDNLMEQFMLSKKVQLSLHEKKTFRNYEKQGAIPKRKFISDSHCHGKVLAEASKNSALNSEGQENVCQTSTASKTRFKRNKSKLNKRKITEDKNQSFHLNADLSKETEMSFSEELHSKPFFYIIPEKPSPKFTLPRGSYYVVPRAPDSSSFETIIFHPEDPNGDICPTNDSDLSLYIKSHRKGNGVDLPVSENNLGKEVVLRTNSSLNIGPSQVRESQIVDNFEDNYNVIKIFNKTVTIPEKSSEAERMADEINAFVLRENEDEKLLNKKSSSEDSDSSSSGVQELEEESVIHDEVTEEIENLRQRLMSLFPDMGSALAGEVAANYFTDEKNLEDFIAARQLKEKIDEQYNRLIQALPNSNLLELHQKSEEFGGDKEKELAYIREVKRRNRSLELMTELQYIFPDASPDYLLEKIEELIDQPDALNRLTGILLDSKEYPKSIRNEDVAKRKLWLTYVEKFNVKDYLLKVPNPKHYAGPGGDNNKANEKLIMQFLTARYPEAATFYLNHQFSLCMKNITKTCASITDFRTVRLSESLFKDADFDENFLKEVCYVDNKDEIDSYIEMMNEQRDREMATAFFEDSFLFCPICSNEELLASEAVTCPEGHIYCKECVKRYVEVKISEAVYKFPCLSENCDTSFTMKTIEELLPDSVSSIIVKKQQAEEVSTAEVDGLEFCTKCDFAYIPNPDDKIFKCLNPFCLIETCRKCHEINHIPLRCEEVERAVDVEARKKIEETMTEKLVRRCPKCTKTFIKIDGCNKIACPCGAIICYICRKIVEGYNHFQNDDRSRFKCPLHSKNEDLHVREIVQAGVQMRDHVLQENPFLHISLDPTRYIDN